MNNVFVQANIPLKCQYLKNESVFIYINNKLASKGGI